ncbi:MAG: DUF2169 domain-containing protein [Polyangiaceae bacterium]
MRAIKPNRLTLLTRTIELARRPRFIVSVIAATPFGTGGAEKACFAEADIWKMFEARVGTGAILDEGYAKPCAEVIVHGAFHAPDKIAVPVSFAGFEVVRDGKKLVDKKVAILGERTFRAGIPSNPKPVLTVPIDWAHAFGGEGFPANPAGRGMKPKGDGPHVLPNVEDPKKLVTGPGDRPPPVSFAPIGLDAVERQKLAGSYGGDYVQRWFPGFPPDVDPTFFCAAPRDQRFEGFFVGGEKIVATNLHPDHPRLEGAVPPLRARAFVDLSRGGETRFEEIPLRCDTLVALPDREACVYVFRGSIEVEEDDASDIEQLLIAAEDASMRRSVEHYRAVKEKRNDRENYGAFFALQDEDLLPQVEAGWSAPRLAPEPLAVELEVVGVAKKRGDARAARITRERRADLEREGLDPDDFLPERPPEEAPPDETNITAVIEYTKKLTARAEAERAKAEAKRAELMVEARETFREMGIDYDEECRKALDATAGPPPFRAEKEIARLAALAELGRTAGVPLLDIEAALTTDALRTRLEKEQKLLLDGYRKAVVFSHPAKAASTELSREKREMLMAAYSAGKELPDEDFTGIDLSGLNLSGARLPGALLERANLEGTILDTADLRGAVLARALLGGARLVGARLHGATLGDGGLRDANFSRADLTEAFLARVAFEDAVFAEADLTGAILFEGSFGATDFSRATLDRLCFFKANMRATRFTGASLVKGSFLECDLSGVDFTGATLDSCIWVDTIANGANLAGASMKKSAWPKGVSFEGGSLKGAKLELGSLRGSNLRRADLSGATLSTMDLGGVDLTEANLSGADMRGALLLRANLTRANARGANLMDALMTNANLSGADFTRANLFRALLSRVVGDDATRFTDANVEFVVKEPVRA